MGELAFAASILLTALGVVLLCVGSFRSVTMIVATLALLNLGVLGLLLRMIVP
jgi:hypothetical protein